MGAERRPPGRPAGVPDRGADGRGDPARRRHGRPAAARVQQLGAAAGRTRVVARRAPAPSRSCAPAPPAGTCSRSGPRPGGGRCGSRRCPATRRTRGGRPTAGASCGPCRGGRTSGLLVRPGRRRGGAPRAGRPGRRRAGVVARCAAGRRGRRDGRGRPALDLLVVGAGGGRAQRLARHVGTGRPSWSPDGTRLAYVDGKGRVCAIDMGTGADRTVAALGGLFAREVTWSPDGRRLAFIAGRQRPSD